MDQEESGKYRVNKIILHPTFPSINIFKNYTKTSFVGVWKTQNKDMIPVLKDWTLYWGLYHFFLLLYQMTTDLVA